MSKAIRSGPLSSLVTETLVKPPVEEEVEYLQGLLDLDSCCLHIKTIRMLQAMMKDPKGKPLVTTIWFCRMKIFSHSHWLP
jgi:hypothetical protein